FEIQSRRKAEKSVGRPREAVNAAVLAAPVRIDRTIKADVGGVVARDHLAGGVDRRGGLDGGQFLKALPAIVEGDPRLGLKTSAGVRLRAAAASAFTVDCNRQLRKRSRTRRVGGRRDRRGGEGVGGVAAPVGRHNTRAR